MHQNKIEVFDMWRMRIFICLVHSHRSMFGTTFVEYTVHHLQTKLCGYVSGWSTHLEFFYFTNQLEMKY